MSLLGKNDASADHSPTDSVAEPRGCKCDSRASSAAREDLWDDRVGRRRTSEWDETGANPAYTNPHLFRLSSASLRVAGRDHSAPSAKDHAGDESDDAADRAEDERTGHRRLDRAVVHVR